MKFDVIVNSTENANYAIKINQFNVRILGLAMLIQTGFITNYSNYGNAFNNLRNCKQQFCIFISFNTCKKAIKISLSSVRVL